jgi:hypothetical protein
MNADKTVWLKIVSDSIIPLLGFFLWDWSIYFIVLFLCLDLISHELVYHLNFNFLRKFQNHSFSKGSLLSLPLVLISLAIIQFSLLVLYSESNPLKELIEFLSYEDMGIAQGYILIPLIGLMAFQEMKLFQMRRDINTINIDIFIKAHIKKRLILLICTLVGLGLAYVQLPEIMILVLIILTMSALQFLLSSR